MFKNFSIFLFLFCATFIVAHPFYKTMSEEDEQKYNQFKKEEAKIIDDFKKKYPKIPDSCWENVKCIEEQKKVWLSDTAPKNIVLEEPEMKEFSSEKDLMEYCSQYIEYECIKQGIDPKKIVLKETSKYTIGFANYDPNKIYITDEGQLFYCIDSEEASEIWIKPEEFIKYKNKKLELKESIFLITEAFSDKDFLIKKFIRHFYNFDPLTSKTFSELRTAYKEKHTDTAKELAQLLSEENLMQKEVINIISHVNKTENTDIDNSHKNPLKKWLKKVIYLCTLPYDPFS
jgi:hypothetical protein